MRIVILTMHSAETLFYEALDAGDSALITFNAANITATNGVIHVINRVMLP